MFNHIILLFITGTVARPQALFQVKPSLSYILKIIKYYEFFGAVFQTPRHIISLLGEE